MPPGSLLGIQKKITLSYFFISVRKVFQLDTKLRELGHYVGASSSNEVNFINGLKGIKCNAKDRKFGQKIASLTSATKKKLSWTIDCQIAKSSDCRIAKLRLFCQKAVFAS